MHVAVHFGNLERDQVERLSKMPGDRRIVPDWILTKSEPANHAAPRRRNHPRLGTQVAEPPYWHCTPALHYWPPLSLPRNPSIAYRSLALSSPHPTIELQQGRLQCNQWLVSERR